MNIWNGTGLPPIGSTVKVLWSSMKPSYVSCIVLAHDEGRALFRFTSGERKGEYQAESHRPINGIPNFRRLTVEELAAEKKAADVSAILFHAGITGSAWADDPESVVWAEALYDAGYRKFEIVEDEV